MNEQWMSALPLDNVKDIRLFHEHPDIMVYVVFDL